MSIPSEHRAIWDEIVQKPHIDQAIWFLNAFWNDGIKEHAEEIWDYTQKFANVDPNGGNGFDHDEFWSHKFLEDMSETVTVLELRAKLGEIDIDKNKRMCLSEYLLFKFQRPPVELILAPQGDPEELAKAQRLVDQASAAVDAVVEKLEQTKAATAEAKAAHQQAKADEAAAAQRQVELQAAKKELEAALEEVKAQEAAYNQKTEQLKAKSEGGGVAALRAKNELAQHLGEDPLPLRRAKITQEAAVKQCERAQKAAAAAEQAAAASAAAAEEKTRELEEATRQQEAALREAEAKRKEALDFLDRVKASGAGAGRVWWMKREMYEKQKYLPTAKQTMPYPKPE